MKQFELKRTLFGADITAQASVLDEGVHVLLTGGECSHVGAVALAQNGELLACPSFPGHKEQVVCERWALALSRETGGGAVAACGIHYDGLGREQIAEVVGLTDDMLDELLHILRTADMETAVQSGISFVSRAFHRSKK